MADGDPIAIPTLSPVPPGPRPPAPKPICPAFCIHKCHPEWFTDEELELSCGWEHSTEPHPRWP